MRNDVFRSVDWREPFVKVGANDYRWITFGADGIIRFADSGPESGVISRQLVESPKWATGGFACRRIGDIDMQTKEYSLEAGETLDAE